jgi:hypothetical protein
MVVELVLEGQSINSIFLPINSEQVISAWFSGVTVSYDTSEVYWRMHKLSTLVTLC